MTEQYQIRPKDQEAGAQIPASFVIQNHYPPKENTMNRLVCFVAGALTGAAAMVGLAFWISEQEGATDSSPKADLEAAKDKTQVSPVQEDQVQAQNGDDHFEETAPST